MSYKHYVKRTRQFISQVRGLIALCLCAAGCLTSAQAQSPLPDDLSITPPASTVVPEAAAFSGAWQGTWGGELPTALIVEQVNSNGTATVIYSWGELPSHQFKSGWHRQSGRIANGRLQLQTKDGPQIDFTLEPGGLLWGRYQLGNEPPSFGELHRIQTTNVPAILAAAKAPATNWVEIRIPLQSQVGPAKGKSIGLQTTIHPQAAGGRHPVVIFNHGSTGPGMVPAKLAFHGGNEAAFFHSLGYVVVMPMRKGRGSSDGPHLEEDFSLTADVQLDSAIEDLQAVVQFVRRRDDVDPARIVVAGVSRGGILSVAYAGRYPTNVAGVINFSGGWFGEGLPIANFNSETFAKAGQGARVPMLWLYADHDSFYSLKFTEKGFARFRESGGRGELIEVKDLAGEGHLLSLWVDRWQNKVTDYLKDLKLLPGL